MSTDGSQSGWNRSSSNRAAAQNRGEKSPSLVKGAVAGAVCVLGAVAAYFAFFSTDGERKELTEDRSHSRLKEVTPAVAPTNAVPEKPKRVVEFKKLENGMIMKYVDGRKAWMFPREDYHGPIHTTRVAHVETLEEKTFKHPADRRLASLLSIRPGSAVLGNGGFDQTFVKKFLDSYVIPFIIEPGDTPEQKELKRAVAEVKGELKARHEAGEDIVKILLDTRDQLRQLYVYKRELEAEVRRYAKDGALTPQDVEDYAAAANKMLSDRGVPPIKLNGFLKHQMAVIKAKNDSAAAKQEDK